MSGRQDWESAGIHNSHALYTEDPGVAINNSHGVTRLSHLAGTTGVPDSLQAALDRLSIVLAMSPMPRDMKIYLQDLSIGLDRDSGIVLWSDDGLLHV